MMMSKSLKIWFAAMTLCGAVVGQAEANPSILVDVGTGKVLAAHDAFQRWYPASLTKLMTTYVTFKALQSGQIRLDSPVRMSVNAAKQPPAKMGYRPGTVMTLNTALTVMLVKSANDIAVAVGEAVGGGSEAAFVQRMNVEARRLGMTGTHFATPNGLYDPNNYTTARDLAVLAVQIRREFPQYAHYFSIEAVDPGNGRKLIPNTNVLLGRFDGADGMKTGFICASGFNLIGAATRGNRAVLAVVLGADSQEGRAVQAAQLLTEAFHDSPSGGPTLATFRPPANAGTLDQVVDMRKTICSQQAMSDRWDARGPDGKLKINSPYIHAMDHPPVAVRVSLISEPPAPKKGKGKGKPAPARKPHPQRAAAN